MGSCSGGPSYAEDIHAVAEDIEHVKNVSENIEDIKEVSDKSGDIIGSVEKAKNWADADVDVEVEPGKNSAKHWAHKAYEVVLEPLLGFADYVMTFTEKTIDHVSNIVGANHTHRAVINNHTSDIPAHIPLTAIEGQLGSGAIGVVPLTDPNTQVCCGISEDVIVKDGTGLMITGGELTDVDTSAYGEDTLLYPKSDGGFTTEKPMTGSYQAVARVARSHDTYGLLEVYIAQPVEYASTEYAGIVKLNDDVVTDDSTVASTAKQAKVLNDTKVDRNERGVMMRVLANKLHKLGAGMKENPDTSPLQANIFVMGDSWTDDRGYWLDGFAERMTRKYGDAGIGWVGFGAYSNSSAMIHGDARGLVTINPVGGWTFAAYFGNGVDCGYAYSSTVGDQIRCVINPINDVTHYTSGGVYLHAKANTGVIRYSWDFGGSWTTIDLSGSNFIIEELVGAPQGISMNAVWIEVVSGTPELYGMDVRSTNPGVCVHKAGIMGSYYEAINNSDLSTQAEMMKTLDLDSILVMMGTNDQAQETLEAYTAYVYAYASHIRQNVSALADLCFIHPPQNNLDRPDDPTLYEMAAKVRQIAKDNKCGFLDLQDTFGEIDDYKWTGDWSSSRNWLDSTNSHPTKYADGGGGVAIVESVIRYITDSTDSAIEVLRNPVFSNGMPVESGTGTVEIDMSVSYHKITATGDFTPVFVNIPSAGLSYVEIEAWNWGAYSVDLSAFQFHAKRALTLTAAGKDKLIVGMDFYRNIEIFVKGSNVGAAS